MPCKWQRQRIWDVVDGWMITPTVTRLENATHFFLRRVKPKYRMIGGKRVKVADGGRANINDLAKMICDAYRMQYPDGSALLLESVILILKYLPEVIRSAIANGQVVDFKKFGVFEPLYTADQPYYVMGDKGGKGGLIKKHYEDFVEIHFSSTISKEQCAGLASDMAEEMGPLRELVRAARAKKRNKEKEKEWIENQKRSRDLKEHHERVLSERERLECLPAGSLRRSRRPTS